MRRRASEGTQAAPATTQAASKPTPPVGADRSTVETAVVENHKNLDKDEEELQRRSVGEVLERALDSADAAEPKTGAASLEMPYGFERIITHQFSVLDGAELEAEYHYLRSQLSFGEERASAKSYGELIDALDKAEDNAMRASELFARASAALAEFDGDALVIASSLRDHVKNTLEERKAEMKRTTGASGKAITNDDIESELAAAFPDEWSALEKRRTQAKLSVKLMGDLKEMLVGRAWDLRTMVGRSRQLEGV